MSLTFIRATRLEWAKAGEGVITVKPLPGRGELARQLMGAGRHLLKPGADPIGDLIREREQDDQLDQADHKLYVRTRRHLWAFGK